MDIEDFFLWFKGYLMGLVFVGVIVVIGFLLYDNNQKASQIDFLKQTIESLQHGQEDTEYDPITEQEAGGLLWNGQQK